MNAQTTTRWHHFIAYFFGGAFLANTIPHLVNGISGSPFQSPFASPPGEGLSSSTVNVLWGMFNLVVAYRALGNDPTRYRGSNEALVRRISQGKDLYRVNTVVDVNNLISLETLHSAGTFDLDRVQPPIMFRIGQPGEIYAGIGRGEIKIEGLPVFADQLGPFGSTTSDSERTMVQLETTRIMMVIISFLGAEGMEAVVGRAAGLLERYAAAAGIESGVVT